MSKTAVAGHDQALPSRCQALPATKFATATEGHWNAKCLIGHTFSLPSSFGNGYTKSLICQGFSLPTPIERVKTDLEVRLSQSLHGCLATGGNASLEVVRVQKGGSDYDN